SFYFTTNNKKHESKIDIKPRGIIEDIPTVESSRKLSQNISIDLLEADTSNDNDLEIESIYQEETIERQFRRQKKDQDNSDFDFIEEELFSGFATPEYAYSDDDPE
ncbi:9195_t:CDS:2, partial [Funneliformis mosseae]